MYSPVHSLTDRIHAFYDRVKEQWTSVKNGHTLASSFDLAAIIKERDALLADLDVIRAETCHPLAVKELIRMTCNCNAMLLTDALETHILANARARESAK